MADPSATASRRQSFIVAVIAVSISILSSVAATSATLARFDERLTNEIIISAKERRTMELRLEKLESLCNENAIRAIEIKKDLEYIKVQLVEVQKSLRNN